MIRSRESVVVFGAPKVGEHVVIGRSGIPQSGPIVVVGPMASDVNHGIDGGRTTETLPFEWRLDVGKVCSAN